MTQHNFPVLCGGATHRVTLDTRGPIILHDHDCALRADEWALARVSGDLDDLDTEARGDPNGCFRLVEAWRRAIKSHDASWFRPLVQQILEDPITRRHDRREAAQRFLFDVTWARAAIACWTAGNWITAALRSVGLPTPPLTISLSRDHSAPILWEERRPPLRIVLPGHWYKRIWHRQRWEQMIQRFDASAFDEKRGVWGAGATEQRLISIGQTTETVTVWDGFLGGSRPDRTSLTFSRGGPGVAQSVHGTGLRVKGTILDVGDDGNHPSRLRDTCQYSYVPGVRFDRKRFDPGTGYHLPFAGDYEMRRVGVVTTGRWRSS